VLETQLLVELVQTVQVVEVLTLVQLRGFLAVKVEMESLVVQVILARLQEVEPL
jgi:hypothetical protein